MCFIGTGVTMPLLRWSSELPRSPPPLSLLPWPGLGLPATMLLVAASNSRLEASGRSMSLASCALRAAFSRASLHASSWARFSSSTSMGLSPITLLARVSNTGKSALPAPAAAAAAMPPVRASSWEPGVRRAPPVSGPPVPGGMPALPLAPAVVGGSGVGAGCASGSYFLMSAMVFSKRVESLRSLIIFFLLSFSLVVSLSSLASSVTSSRLTTAWRM
mmetsp:Transcript_37059/g.93467  ORF Transcript_37059/g.93467 Transcript_37059/m.93467 type:complete len:218 (+) Transcript_37059:331-984(+)